MSVLNPRNHKLVNCFNLKCAAFILDEQQSKLLKSMRYLHVQKSIDPLSLLVLYYSILSLVWFCSHRLLRETYEPDQLQLDSFLDSGSNAVVEVRMIWVE